MPPRHVAKSLGRPLALGSRATATPLATVEIAKERADPSRAFLSLETIAVVLHRPLLDVDNLIRIPPPQSAV